MRNLLKFTYVIFVFFLGENNMTAQGLMAAIYYGGECTYEADYQFTGYGTVLETGNTVTFINSKVNIRFYEESTIDHINVKFTDGSGGLYNLHENRRDGTKVYKHRDKNEYYLVDNNHNVVLQSRDDLGFGTFTINYGLRKLQNMSSNSSSYDLSTPSSPSHGATLVGGPSSSSSSSSSATSHQRLEQMYKSQYAKRVELFNSDLYSLQLVKGSSSEIIIRSTLRKHQNEMRNIRNDAQQNGIYIPQAYEENASF